MTAQQLMALVRAEIGTKEIAGAADSKEILQYAKDSGNAWIVDDETPWCATFVGAMLARAGLSNTKRANARSYLTWGVGVKLADAQPGDVVVLWRKSKTSASGHVFFYTHTGKDGKIHGIGGNQSDAVSAAGYPLDRVLAIRRAPEIAAPGAVHAPISRASVAKGTGRASRVVRKLQQILSGLGYALGGIDGKFGPLTSAALRAFQENAGLVVDGVAGPATWAALDSAPRRADRTATVAGLVKAGSSITAVSVAGQLGAAATAVSAAAALMPQVIDATKSAQAAFALWKVLAVTNPATAVLAIVGAGGFLGYRKIMKSRVRDARTHRNIGRAAR